MTATYHESLMREGLAMRQKYVFLDVDGTLFTHKGELPDSAIKAMKQAHANGHKIFLCTGRAKGEIPALLWKQAFDGVVCSAGAYVEAEGEVIHDAPMSKEQTKRLTAFFDSHKFSYIYETYQGIVGNKRACDFFNMNVKRLKMMNKKLPDDFFGTLTIQDKWDGITPVYKMLFFSKERAVEKLMAELGDAYTVVHNTLPIVGVCSGEVSAPGMHKARGIEQIMEFYGGGMEDTVAFGDGSNDYEMLDYVHLGVAMGNGAESLKKIADMVTEPVDADGLYRGFIMAGLIGEKNVCRVE